MKQVPQNEIDVLLRRWSQSEQVGAAKAESAHLDPDELSAYAENALPPAARAKYTEHLADCSACRRIVADLAPLTATVPLKKEATFSVGAFLSKLIAPSILRYAVPSLAAVLILAMGFFVMNRQSGNRQSLETVAKNEQPTAARNEQLNDSSPTNVGAAKTESGTVHDQSPTTAKKAEPKPAEATAAGPQAQATPADAPADVKRYQQEQDKKPEVDRIDVSRQAASQPAAASLSPGVVGGERELAKSRDEDSKKKVAASEPPPQPAPAKEAKEEARKLDSTDVAAGAPKTQQAPVARRARGIGGMASNTVGRDDQDKNTANKDEAETRKVGGRSFRKLNGVWTDTAYDSRATTNLSRGSEQFRALVADEPAIRSIAEQLDGELIVVWKGRAYRIR